MPICQKCNANLPNNAVFCGNCGQKVNTSAPQQPAPQQPISQQPIPQQPIPQQPAPQQPVPQQNYTPMKLHCPNCNSHNIAISTESSVNSAVTTHHGSHSSTRVSNTHRNYWFCNDCGTKFRNIQNLEEEIQRSKLTPVVMFILSAITAAVFCYFVCQIMNNSIGIIFFGTYTFAAGLASVFFLIGGFICRNNLKKMRKELEYLRVACFR